MVKVSISLMKGIDENASHYFEKAKKAKKRLEGVKAVIDKSRQQLIALEKQLQAEEEQTEQHKQRKKEWYEKFRWFFTSTGFLAIGGRDATTNEIVIKKHTESNDVVFHTDMAGSPFFVLKTEGKVVDEQTMREVADATCTFSRAFKLGLGAQSVFFVKPEQVSKEANAGEFLTKGSFMIRGKTTYLDNGINCAIGKMEDGKALCGPVEAVKKHCPVFLTITQGDGKPSDIAKKVMKKLGLHDMDEVIRVLPSGGMKVS